MGASFFASIPLEYALCALGIDAVVGDTDRSVAAAAAVLALAVPTSSPDLMQAIAFASTPLVLASWASSLSVRSSAAPSCGWKLLANKPE